MHGRTPWLSIALLGVMCAAVVRTQTPAATGVTLYEGARLIPGDGPPIEDSAFVVENGRFTRVGRKGEVQPPRGAARVDLTGKTVMPTLIELHTHLGYWKGMTNGVENYTRENLIDQLQRFAYHGVAAVMSMGTDRAEIAYQLRNELRRAPLTNAALYFTAGQGISLPNAGPLPPMRPAVTAVTTEAEARAAVQQLAAYKVDRWVKIWHDNTRARLPPPLYRAIIDEAHKRNLKVVAHVQDLEGIKELLRAGLDGFAHGIWRDEPDDELIQLIKDHPGIFSLTTFWAQRNDIFGARPAWMDDALIRETFSSEEIERLKNLDTPLDAPQKWAATFTPRIKKLRAAGLRIGIGGDTGGITSLEFFGWSAHMEVNSLVKAGLTPIEALAAGTSAAAQIFGLDDRGAIGQGKIADFLVLDANPLEDIGNTRRISDVFLRGQKIDRAALRAKWIH
jgi:imidazolonepropionase-like amidohydrolase